MSKNMLAISSEWNGELTFKMIPVDIDCPFNECIFDPKSRALAIISKEIKESFHTMPKLDSKGDIEVTTKRKNNKSYAEQRVMLDTYYEYYITNQEEILAFVEKFTVNPEYDFTTIVNKSFTEQVQ